MGLRGIGFGLFGLAACSAAPPAGGFANAGPAIVDGGQPDQETPDAGTSFPDAGASTSPQDGGFTLTGLDAGYALPDGGLAPDDDAGLPSADAGPLDAGTGIDGVPNSAPVCTSGVYWLLGNVGTDLMNPGQACIQCHSTNNGPTFTAAGTVYPTTHEPNNCDGVNGGVQIVLTDANGQVTNLTANVVGSFHTDNAIAFPYTAQTISGSASRSMMTPQVTGDCNSCHTQDGANGAPGRIVAP